MSKAVSGTLLVLMAGAVALSGCSSGASVPDPTASVVTSVAEPKWTVIIDPPEGWVLYYPRIPYNALVVREGYGEGDIEGVLVSFVPADVIRNDKHLVGFDAESGALDVDVYRDSWLARYGAGSEQRGEAKSIGSRSIGGRHAAGVSYTMTREGEVHVCQFWMVWRSEGLWDFYVCSAPGGSEVAPELVAALDTTRWVDTPPTFVCSPGRPSSEVC